MFTRGFRPSEAALPREQAGEGPPWDAPDQGTKPPENYGLGFFFFFLESNQYENPCLSVSSEGTSIP